MRLLISLVAAAIWAVLLNKLSNYIDFFWAVTLSGMLAVLVVYLGLTEPAIARAVFGSGERHPLMLVVVAAVVGAALFGGGVWLLQERYQRGAKKAAAADRAATGVIVLDRSPVPLRPQIATGEPVYILDVNHDGQKLLGGFSVMAVNEGQFGWTRDVYRYRITNHDKTPLVRASLAVGVTFKEAVSTKHQRRPDLEAFSEGSKVMASGTLRVDIPTAIDPGASGAFTFYVSNLNATKLREFVEIQMPETIEVGSGPSRRSLPLALTDPRPLALLPTETHRNVTTPTVAPASSPVAWELESIFSAGTFRGDRTLRFSGFIVHGNNGDRPIGKLSAYIRSNITNEKLPMRVTADGKLLSPDETEGVPPKARIELTALFGPDAFDDITQMLTEPALLERFSDCTFVVELDGQRDEYRFPRAKIDQMITGIKLRLFPPPKPRIQPKRSPPAQ